MFAIAGLLLLTLGIFGNAAAALRAASSEIAVRQAIGARPFQAARAPRGMLAGLLFAPLVLSVAEGLGITSGGIFWPLLIGALSVLGAAAVAAGPSIWRLSRISPAELLREVFFVTS